MDAFAFPFIIFLKIHVYSFSMRIPNRKLHTAVDGGDSGVSAHFKNPFVHELRYTPLQKLKVKYQQTMRFLYFRPLQKD